MKKTVLLAVVLLLVSFVSYGQMTDLAETITAKEKEVYEAIKAGDMETFGTYLADNFMSVDAMGIVDRAKELEKIANLKLDTYELSDIQVVQPAEGMAIITYILNGSGRWEQEQFSGTYYSTSTWMMMDGGEWKAIMHTETKAAPMEEAVGMEEMEK